MAADLITRLQKIAGQFFFAAGTVNVPEDDKTRQDVLGMVALLNEAADALTKAEDEIRMLKADFWDCNAERERWRDRAIGPDNASASGGEQP